MIARLPAALSLRFFLAGAGTAAQALLDSFLEAAHLLRCAAAIRRRAAADIFRLGLTASGVAPSMGLPFSICRSSAIRSLICFFCCSKPSIAAVRISVLCFVGIQSVWSKLHSPYSYYSTSGCNSILAGQCSELTPDSNLSFEIPQRVFIKLPGPFALSHDHK